MKFKQQTLKYLVYLRSVIWQFYSDKIYYAIGASVLFGLLIYFLNHFFYPSTFWFQFTTELNIDTWFCERTDMMKFVRQPINTFTNFGYLVNAIFFFTKSWQDYKREKPYNLLTTNPFYSFIVGIIALYTFACSTFFHSSLISFASDLDFSAVYSISLFPLMYYSHRFVLIWKKKPTNEKHPVEARVLTFIFSVIYILLTFFVPLDYVHYFVVVFIFLTGLLGYILDRLSPSKTNKIYLWLMVGFITSAMVFFKMDTAKIGCNPDSFIQPHSLWHLLNGFAVFYFYLYIRSENYIAEKDEKLLPFKKKYLH